MEKIFFDQKSTREMYQSKRKKAENDLTEEELDKYRQHQHGKALVLKMFSTTLFHPLSFGKTLIQLGHEPYPLSKGKKRLFFGQFVYFQPNILKYLRNTYEAHGLAAIYTGIGSHVLVSLTSDVGTFFTTLYLDKYFPEIGGDIDDLEEAESVRELDNYQLLRLKMRQAIRGSISAIVGITVSRPFAVIMIRQIAQHIGNDTKYSPFFPLQPLVRVGAEEGVTGLFAGLIPQLIGGLIYVWGVAAVDYGVEQGIRYLEKNIDEQDESARDAMNQMRFACNKITTLFLANSWRYPFEVVSTIMAVAGSGLVVSMLPYTPLFTNWEDAYEYLKPHELKRGANLFLREEKGPVGVGLDGKLYASKKHFI